MLEGRFVRKITVEALLLVVLSVVLLIIGSFLSSDEENRRVQQKYKDRFGHILEADYYEELDASAYEGYDEISHVYEGFRNDGSPVGFVIDLTVNTKDYTELHLLTGITFDGAELTGIEHIHDEQFPASITDEEIQIIAGQTVDMQVPVALAGSDAVIDPDMVSNMIPGLNDGTYYAQMLEADNSGYIDYIEMDVEDGVITRISWDAFNIDRTTRNKREASLNGAYSVSGELWATQSYNLCHELLTLQDPSELAMKSDGTTDIVDGVTISIRPFVDLVNECIGYSREGYDKDSYMEDMTTLVTYLFQDSPENLGMLTDEGYIVYSFEDYPNLFKIFDENEVYIRDLSISEAADAVSGGLITTEDEEGGEEGDDNDNSSVNDPGYINEGYEDGIIPEGERRQYEDSIDGIPVSEIRTYIDGIPGSSGRSEYVISGINISYKFLKSYLGWMA
ncbi:MAG: hypothetical protein J5883_03545 [Clostridiales bacterium]|nr:hypothetical protein [Clostridiales bacterium]